MYTVFEPLNADTYSALRRANLADLVESGVLSIELAEAFASIEPTMTALIAQPHEQGHRSATTIRAHAS